MNDASSIPGVACSLTGNLPSFAKVLNKCNPVDGWSLLSDCLSSQFLRPPIQPLRALFSDVPPPSSVAGPTPAAILGPFRRCSETLSSAQNNDLGL